MNQIAEIYDAYMEALKQNKRKECLAIVESLIEQDVPQYFGYIYKSIF